MIKTRTRSGKQLKEFLKSLGITPVDLACRLSPPVERQTVIRWYDGSRIPSIDYQKQLYQLSDKKVLLSGWMTEKELVRENWLKNHPIHQQSESEKTAANGASHATVKAPIKAATNGNGRHGKPRQRTAKRVTTRHADADDSNGAPAGGASTDDSAGPTTSASAALHARGPRAGVRSAAPANETGAGEHVRRSDESIVPIVENPESRKASDNTGNAGTSSKIAVSPTPSRMERVDAGSAGSANGSKVVGAASAGGSSTNGSTGANRTFRPVTLKPPPSKPTSHTIVNGQPPGATSPGTNATNAVAPGANAPEASRTNHEGSAAAAKVGAGSASGLTESVAAKTQPTGPIRKNHSECSPDNAMERMKLAKSGGIQFEVVDVQGVVLECHQDVVTARNVLDSRVHPSSYAVRCKFCWTQVSIYTPPRPEVTERLARSISDGHAKIDA